MPPSARISPPSRSLAANEARSRFSTGLSCPSVRTLRPGLPEDEGHHPYRDHIEREEERPEEGGLAERETRDGRRQFNRLGWRNRDTGVSSARHIAAAANANQGHACRIGRRPRDRPRRCASGRNRPCSRAARAAVEDTRGGTAAVEGTRGGSAAVEDTWRWSAAACDARKASEDTRGRPAIRDTRCGAAAIHEARRRAAAIHEARRRAAAIRE